jgi:hypothetical protein
MQRLRNRCSFLHYTGLTSATNATGTIRINLVASRALSGLAIILADAGADASDSSMYIHSPPHLQGKLSIARFTLLLRRLSFVLNDCLSLFGAFTNQR